MILRFLQLELKSFFRGAQLGGSIAMKIGMFILYTYFAMIFVGGAFSLYFISKEENQDPLQLFFRFFMFYWVGDLLFKYFAQQLSTNNIKPFLTQNISKSQIAGYTLLKILVSFFSWAFLLFIIPFTILLLMDGKYNTLQVLAVVLSTTFLIFSNTFINALINKNNFLLYIVVGAIAVLGGLHYFNIINVLDVSERVFNSMYTQPIYFLLPLILLTVIGFFTFNFIKNSLYLDKGLELKKTVGKTENIEFLNKYGAVGTFLNNDIRLIKRSKAARGAAMGALFFLFYGVFFMHSSNAMSPIFPGIFITGGFLFVFGQKVPAWDSSYYPLMLTQNVPYKEYLKAKWYLLVIVTLISMILAVAYVFFMGWTYYFTILAAGCYNLGVNAYLTLLSGAYLKKPIDLNSATKGFAGGQNSFNLKLFLIVIPQMILPILVFVGVDYLLGTTLAIVSVALLGFIGFFLRDRVFDAIVKVYKTEKYSTLAAFKKLN